MARAAPARVHTPVPRGRVTSRVADARVARRGVPAVSARAGLNDTGDIGESPSTSSSAPPVLSASRLGRREALGTAVALTTGLLSAPVFEARAVDDSEPSTSRPSVDYTARGPYGVKRLPKLEHVRELLPGASATRACSASAYVPTPPPVLPDAMFPLTGAVPGDGDVPGTRRAREAPTRSRCSPPGSWWTPSSTRRTRGGCARGATSSCSTTSARTSPGTRWTTW